MELEFFVARPGACLYVERSKIIERRTHVSEEGAGQGDLPELPAGRRDPRGAPQHADHSPGRPVHASGLVGTFFPGVRLVAREGSAGIFLIIWCFVTVGRVCVRVRMHYRGRSRFLAFLFTLRESDRNS